MPTLHRSRKSMFLVECLMAHSFLFNCNYRPQVVPTAKATQLTMNREGIRRLAAETLGLPTSPYRFAQTRAEFDHAVKVGGLWSLPRYSSGLQLRRAACLIDVGRRSHMEELIEREALIDECLYCREQDMGFPCVVKPIMSSSGKGQSVLRTEGELQKAWDYAQACLD